MASVTVLSAGCAPMQFATTGGRNAELSWQAIHLIDTAQTITIARSPNCLYERDPVAAAVYGSKNPSVGRVVITNAAMGALHWAAGSWLDRHAEYALHRDTGSAGAWYIARGGYYALSLLGSGAAVVGNVRLGVRPLARVRCGEGAR